MIRSKDDLTSILTEKCSSEVEKSVKAKLQLLNVIASARKAFREKFDGVSNDKDHDESHGVESRIIIEEMMLLLQSALPNFKETTLQKAQALHDELTLFEKERATKKR